MATNRRLRADLLERLSVTPQRLSQRVQKLKSEHGPMSTEYATYVIAHQNGLDLTKYLDSNIVEKIQTLVPRAQQNAVATTREKKNRTKTQTTVIIDPNLPKIDAFLTTAIVKDAQKMANLYPKYYVLENSIRIVIMRILEKSHGVQWWQTRVKKSVRLTVADRMAREAEKPWHGKRGKHEIFYSNFGDLKSIITNNWSAFQDLFPSQAWITQKLEELEHPRNVMAHHNPVNSQDFKRIELYFDDWVALLKGKKHLIP